MAANPDESLPRNLRNFSTMQEMRGSKSFPINSFAGGHMDSICLACGVNYKAHKMDVPVSTYQLLLRFGVHCAPLDCVLTAMHWSTNTFANLTFGLI